MGCEVWFAEERGAGVEATFSVKSVSDRFCRQSEHFV